MRLVTIVGSAIIATMALTAINATMAEAKTKNASKGYCGGLIRAKQIKDKAIRSSELNKCVSDPGSYQ